MLHEPKKIKVLITGANGYIGENLINALNSKHDITAIGRQELDLTNTQSVNEFFLNKHFDVIIHTAIVGGSRLKKDEEDSFYKNILMFYNLINCKNSFSRFINFGSGAEFNQPTTPYGLSKNIIKSLIANLSNFYNIRIYAVFDENELDTRFIKANIKRYKYKEPIYINQDKLMDFFYMQDLIRVIDNYISNDEMLLAKTFNCSYSKKYSLSDIANIINNLSAYKCKVIVESKEMGAPYIGLNSKSNIDFVGLEQGIQKVWKQIKN